MNNNQGIVFKDKNKVKVENFEIPVPSENEVLIETKCSLISTGTELTILSGEFPADSLWNKFAKYPFNPGYNNVGHIVEVGKNVEESYIGQRVATCNNHKKYVVSSIDELRPIPDGVADEDAVFFTIAEIVMNGIRRGEISWGESAAVFGLGLLGQLAVRIAYVAGARPVIGLDIAESRLDYMPDNNGIVAINTKDSDWVEQVKKITKERMVDTVVELTGNSSVITSEFQILRDQGRFVVLSSPKGEKTLFNFHDLCNSPSYKIIGAHNNSHPPVATLENPWTKKRDAELFFEYLKDGSIEVNSMISHRCNYKDSPEIYELLLKDRSQAMGVILEW